MYYWQLRLGGPGQIGRLVIRCYYENRVLIFKHTTNPLSKPNDCIMDNQEDIKACK